MLASLWLPVLVAAVAVFVASSLVHMVLRWHQSDFSRLPNEDAVRAALREAGQGAGQFITPWCEGMKEAQSPDMQAKYAEGPIAIITTLRPGKPTMPKAENASASQSGKMGENCTCRRSGATYTPVAAKLARPTASRCSGSAIATGQSRPSSPLRAMWSA